MIVFERTKTRKLVSFICIFPVVLLGVYSCVGAGRNLTRKNVARIVGK